MTKYEITIKVTNFTIKARILALTVSKTTIYDIIINMKFSDLEDII